MTWTLAERRRARRVPVDEGSWVGVASSWPVNLIDISLGGVAFASPYELTAGRTATIRAALGATAAFHGELRVRWSRPRAVSMGESFETGAALLPLNDDSRLALQAFLKVPSASRGRA